MPWSDVWRGSGRSMDTNRCHRASEDALEAPRMAIAVPGDLQESMGPGKAAWGPKSNSAGELAHPQS